MSSCKNEAEDPDYVATDANAELIQMMAEGRSFSSHERNCCFLNTRGTGTDGDRFATVSAVTGLDVDDDGRALVAVDWDHDGDLDLWITNRNAPRIRFFRNQSASGNRFVQFRLHGNGQDANADAVGARVMVYLRPSVVTGGLPGTTADAPVRLLRTVTAGDGFQSQSALDLHFGLGEVGEIERVVVRWPNRAGAEEEFRGVELNRLNELRQGAGTATPLEPRRGELALNPSPPQVPASDGRHRIPLAYPFAAPEMGYYGFDGKPHDILFDSQQVTLINLWSTTCKPCLQELSEFVARADELKAAGVRVVALSIDELESGDPKSVQAAEAMARRLNIPFEVGMAPPLVIDRLRKLHDVLIFADRPLPMPSSFLVNREGKMDMIYKGPVSVDMLLADARPFQGDSVAYQQRAASLPGTLLLDPALAAAWKRNLATTRYMLTRELVESQNTAAAEREYLSILEDWPDNASVYNDLGVLQSTKSSYDKAIDYLKKSIALDSGKPESRFNLIRAYELSRNYPEAKRVAQQAVTDFPDHPDSHFLLGVALLRDQDRTAARQSFERAIRLRPQHGQALYSLGKLILQMGDAAGAIPHLKKASEIANHEPALVIALGEAYLAQRQFSDAEKVLRAVVEQNPGRPDAHYQLGMALLGLQRRSEALAELQTTLRIDPGYPGANEALQQILRAGGAGEHP